MKLYYTPGACSLSPHIVIKEVDLPVELVKVDLRKHTLEDGTDYRTINPLGYIPALELDNGTLLLEGPAIVQYLGDQKPEKGVVPPNGSIKRYQLQQMLNFLSTELHKGFGPLFYAQVAGKYAELASQKLRGRFEWINEQLGSRSYLMGDSFTVADAYLFTLTGWCSASWITTYFNTGLDLSGGLENLQAWYGRMRERPAVQQALKEEGLA
jgi:glutathione S-transferase